MYEPEDFDEYQAGIAPSEYEIERTFNKEEPIFENKELDRFHRGSYDAASYSVLTIAAYLLHLAWTQDSISPNLKEGLTAIKVEQLLYFIQQEYARRFDRALFKDAIFRTKYGPLIIGIREKYKHYATSPIPITEDELDMLEGNVFDPAIIFVIDKIWDKYKNFTSTKLLELLRKQVPWADTKGTYEKYSFISLDEIKRRKWWYR
jgi:uncharacterized phage-associated protein